MGVSSQEKNYRIDENIYLKSFSEVVFFNGKSSFRVGHFVASTSTLRDAQYIL